MTYQKPVDLFCHQLQVHLSAFVGVPIVLCISEESELSNLHAKTSKPALNEFVKKFVLKNPAISYPKFNKGVPRRIELSALTTYPNTS